MIKAVALAATAFLLLSAEGCPADSAVNPGGTKHFIYKDGEYKLGSNNGKHYMTIAGKQYTKLYMGNSTKNCKWATFYDTGATSGIIIQQGTENNTTVNFDKSKMVWNKKTGKGYKLKATSFRTAGCGQWSTS